MKDITQQYLEIHTDQMNRMVNIFEENKLKPEAGKQIIDIISEILVTHKNYVKCVTIEEIRDKFNEK